MAAFAKSVTRIGVFALTLLPSVLGANILISALYGEGSHFAAGASIGEGLADRGHNVTCLISRAFEERVTDKRYAKLSFEIFDHENKSAQDVRDFFRKINELALYNSQEQISKSLTLVTETMADDCKTVLQDSALMNRLAITDAIVMDVAWPCGMLIKHTLQKNSNKTTIPIVSLTPAVSQAAILSTYGSTYNPAYQPEVTSGFTNRMSFRQKILNIFLSIFIRGMLRYFSLPVYTKLSKDVGLDEGIGDLGKWNDYFDLYLLNMDFAIEFPIPITPNIIPVGGLTARAAGRIDNKELLMFVDEAGEDGVIVFTLGTYFASVTDIWPEFTESFAEAFRRLPQRVVWQLTDLPELIEAALPPNVMTLPWVPQNDLLGHPNTRLFLFQGGNNGFYEACYHGVPTVVVPLHGDQYDVAARIEARGMGRKIDKFNLDPGLIVEVLSDVMNDPKYKTVASQVSAIMRDNPTTARDRAAHWIEHVIKYGGDHLKSSATELSFVQYYLLDVIAALLSTCLFISLLGFLVLRSCIRCCYRFLCGSRNARKPKVD